MCERESKRFDQGRYVIENRSKKWTMKWFKWERKIAHSLAQFSHRAQFLLLLLLLSVVFCGCATRKRFNETHEYFYSLDFVIWRMELDLMCSISLASSALSFNSYTNSEFKCTHFFVIAITLIDCGGLIFELKFLSIIFARAGMVIFQHFCGQPLRRARTLPHDQWITEQNQIKIAQVIAI